MLCNILFSFVEIYTGSRLLFVSYNFYLSKKVEKERFKNC